MRQFYPVMAGAAERFRRYSPGLWQRGVRLNAVARQADAALPLAEQLHQGLRVQSLFPYTTLFRSQGRKSVV